MDLVPGRACHPVARGDEDLVAPAVALKGDRGLVRLSPVRFHRDSLPLPEEVDHQLLLAEAKRLVAGWAREPQGEQPWQDERLEIAAHVRDGAVFGAPRSEDRAQAGNSSPASGPEHGSVQGLQVQLLQHRRPLHRSPQRGGSEHSREVDQRPGRRRHGQALLQGDLFGCRIATAPAADPRDLAPRLSSAGHVDQHWPPIANAPQCRRRSVREHRTLAAREEGCPQLSFPAYRLMPHRVGSAMNSMEAALGCPIFRGPLAQLDLAELVE